MMIGLLLRSLLDGFVSSSVPSSCLRPFLLPNVTKEDVRNVEEEWSRVHKIKQSKIRSSNRHSGPDLEMTTIRRRGSRRDWLQGEKVGQRKNVERSQLAADKQSNLLDFLTDELHGEVLEMRDIKILLEKAQSTKGKLSGILGFALACRLFIRLVRISVTGGSGVSGGKGNNGATPPDDTVS